MARQATGQVVVDERGGRRTFAIRFRAYGRRHYRTLGAAEDGWTRERAESELENVLADVRRGYWQQEAPPAAEPLRRIPTFHEFASEWYAAKEPELAARTRVDYRWRLSNHLLPYFADHRLDAITVQEVDRYRAEKIRERDRVQRTRALGKTKRRPLSNESINKTLVLLAAVLEQAIEYGYLQANPARGRRRRLKAAVPARTFLHPAQVHALLAAAGRLDDQAPREGDCRRRQPLLATLTLAGLRVGEALNLRWRDVNLGAGHLQVADAKTPAGVRRVDLTPALRELLTEYRARARHTRPSDYVFATEPGYGRTRGRQGATAGGGRDDEANVRRLLARAVKAANDELADSQPIPAGLTPHSLRRTYISLQLAGGADVRYVMGQVGHTDPGLTLRIYAQVIDADRSHGAQVDELVGAAEWAATGSKTPFDGVQEADRGDPLDVENPAGAGLSERADEGTRTLDLLHGKHEGRNEKPHT